jgi:hypothetical protein
LSAGRRATLLILAALGLSTPYVASLRAPTPIGWDGLSAFLFLQAFNAAWWLPALAGIVVIRSFVLACLPFFAGLGGSFYFYRDLDLSADAQAALALVFYPLYAAGLALFTLVVATLADRAWKRPSSPG